MPHFTGSVQFSGLGNRNVLHGGPCWAGGGDCECTGEVGRDRHDATQRRRRCAPQSHRLNLELTVSWSVSSQAKIPKSAPPHTRSFEPCVGSHGSLLVFAPGWLRIWGDSIVVARFRCSCVFFVDLMKTFPSPCCDSESVVHLELIIRCSFQGLHRPAFGWAPPIPHLALHYPEPPSLWLARG